MRHMFFTKSPDGPVKTYPKRVQIKIRLDIIFINDEIHN